MATVLEFDLNFDANATKWVKSYLTGRKQRVQVEESRTSDWTSVKDDVPAGTCLGPLLFSIYINKISTALKYSKYHLFADDYQIYIDCKPEECTNCLDKLNMDLESTKKWTDSRGLKINPTKTQAMIIGTKNNVKKAKELIGGKVSIAGEEIEYSTAVKNLGVFIDENLTWKKNITETIKKAYGTLHALNRLRHLLSLDVKKKLVQCLIMPYFNYCDTIQLNIPVSESGRLQKCLNSCVRYVCLSKRRDHITPYYKELKWLKIEDSRRVHVATMVYKVLRSKEPSYLKDVFKFFGENQDRETRNRNKTLVIPTNQSSLFGASFAVVGARTWNLVPETVKTAKTAKAMRVAYSDYIITSY